MRAYIGGGDFIDTEPAEDGEHECDLRLLAQSRVTARKPHPQKVVFDCAGSNELFNGWRESPFALMRRLNSGSKVRAVRSRRSASMARFLAVAMSQADGFSGTPRTF